MSLDFIKEREGSKHLATARRQQRQLSYFLQSNIQEDVALEYFKTWAESNYRSNDDLFNWVKTVFRKENFLSFYKYLRFPLISSKIINDEIKPQLKRVYYADDSYFNYVVKGQEINNPDELDNKCFEDILFNAMLFRHNDIIVHDLNDINSPYREIIAIENIIAIDSDNNKIERVCYSACIESEDESKTEIEGYLYIDDKEYVFYDRDLTKAIKTIPHDLGYCPACWVSNEPFSTDNDIVRKSIFSYVKRDLEKLVFLNTLLEMSEPNGAIPTVVKIKTTSNKTKDIKGESDKEPMASNSITSQQAEFGKTVQGSESFLQTGTQISIPLDKLKDTDGKFNTDLITNFAKFIYIPTECLDYMNKRITEIKNGVIQNVLGDYTEQNQSAKNELQVGKSYINKQDILRAISLNLSWVRNQSDKTILALKYGIDNVDVSVFYGSDFFLDNENDLFDLFKNAPNPIERRTLLKRIGKTRYRFNPSLAERTTLLYSLMPFTSDVDFDKAISNSIIDDTTKQLQLQFDYWIAMFESEYGDILQFYKDSKATENEKLIMIKNLILNLIITNGKQN